MPFEVAPGPLLGALSGIAVIGLGSATLLVRPLPRPAAAFGFLALLWGLQVTVANTAEGFTDPPTKLLWINATVALAILVAAALAVVVLAWRAPAGAFRPVALLPVALAGAALEAALFLEPGLFVRGLSLEPGLPVATGPLFLPVITGANIVAFTVALAVLGERFRRPLPPVAREQFSLVIAALVAYVSYRAGEAFDFLLYANAYVALDGSGGYAFELAAALLAAGVLAGVLAVVLPRPDLPWRDLHVVVAIVPLAVAVGQSLLGAPQGATAGVWRLVMVALFAYAIARYRLFDIEVRLGQLAPALAYAGIAGAGLAVLWVAAWPTLTAVPLLGLVASAGVAAACAPAARLGPWIKHRAAPHLAEPDYLYKRKVDVYRAALEEAQGRGMGDATEQAFLSDLRRRLGISEQEHRLLTLIVQAQSRYGPRAPTPGMERFRVEKELGRGGFARALLALDTRLQRRVVLKQPLGPWLADPTYRKQFLQEARLAARIQHPNVVTVYEVLTEEEPPLLVLEYVDGSNLETELRARGRLPPQEAVRVALEVLAGLERIHAEGIVHRDLKPANILLAADGTAKVTDFGVAQAPREAALAATVMSGGGQPGTLAYMSPEQVRGEDVDARTDLYALAAVLVECLTGAHYAAGWEDEFELRKRILTTPPALDHEGIPAGLAPVLAQALAKRPDERPADARAMARAMRKAVPELARRAAARTTAP